MKIDRRVSSSRHVSGNDTSLSEWPLPIFRIVFLDSKTGVGLPPTGKQIPSAFGGTYSLGAAGLTKEL